MGNPRSYHHGKTKNKKQEKADEKGNDEMNQPLILHEFNLFFMKLLIELQLIWICFPVAYFFNGVFVFLQISGDRNDSFDGIMMEKGIEFHVNFECRKRIRGRL